MPATTIKVWRYSKPGMPPLPTTVKRNSKPGRGRWRGKTTCNSEDCGTWVSDIDHRYLEACMPMPCPRCKERSAYPELLWRKTVLQCGYCGTTMTYLSIDLTDAWPLHVDCPECEAQVTVPIVGTALIH